MMIDDANIWRFNVAGSKEVRDYRVKEITFATTRNLRWSWHEITGIVFAPDKSVQSDLQDGTLVPCFQQPYEWWLDLVAIFRKREYQPGGSSMCWMKCCVKFATSLLSRSNCGLNKRRKAKINDRDKGNAPSWSCVIALCASPRHG